LWLNRNYFAGDRFADRVQIGGYILRHRRGDRHRGRRPIKARLRGFVCAANKNNSDRSCKNGYQKPQTNALVKLHNVLVIQRVGVLVIIIRRDRSSKPPLICVWYYEFPVVRVAGGDPRWFFSA